MSESAIHIELVNHMAEWVVNKLLDGNDAYLLIDGPFSKYSGRPPLIIGHMPDLYVYQKAKELLVIGEAKTSKDLDSERSEKQIGAFLSHCSSYSNSIFVLAVPWYKARFADSLLRMIQRSIGGQLVFTKVLEMLPG